MKRNGYITVSKAAKLKGCSRQAIHNAIQTDRLTAVAETVEKIEWKVCPRSLARLKINSNMKRAGRPRKGEK